MLRRKYALASLSLIGVVFILLTMMNLWKGQLQEYNTFGNQKMYLVERILKVKLVSNDAFSDLTEHGNFTAFHGLPQKCKIPVLDPYHPDVKPFYKTWSVPDCDYPQLSEVTDEGYLQVRHFRNTCIVHILTRSEF